MANLAQLDRASATNLSRQNAALPLLERGFLLPNGECKKLIKIVAGIKIYRYHFVSGSIFEGLGTKMGKDRAAQIWTLQALAKVVALTGDFVSAGQVARYMGIARNTAAKRLKELDEMGELEGRVRQCGRVTIFEYCPKSNKVRGN